MGPIVYPSPQTVPHAMPGNCYMPAQAPVTYSPPMEMPSGFAAPQPAFPFVHQPVYYPQGVRAVYPRPAVLHQPIVHRRPLLPRTEGSAVPSQPVFGPQRVLRPHVPVSQASRSSVSSVSSQPAYSQGVPQYTPVSTQGRSGVPSPVTQRQPSSVVGPIQPMVTPYQELASQTRPVGPVGYLSDHTEDWSSFIQFDQEDPAVSSGSMRSEPTALRMYRRETDTLCSYAARYGSVPAFAPAIPSMDAKPVVPRPERDANPGFQGSPAIAAAVPSEIDEGRHRTHPLYNEGPHDDGLYHCPFKSDPSCQHNPTKLKCNYEYDTTHELPFY